MTEMWKRFNSDYVFIVFSAWAIGNVKVNGVTVLKVEETSDDTKQNPRIAQGVSAGLSVPLHSRGRGTMLKFTQSSHFQAQS
jgi:hypothetical protein